MRHSVVIPLHQIGSYAPMQVADEASELEILLSAHAAPDVPPLVLGGCWDVLSASMLQTAGHQSAWLDRAAIARARFGRAEADLVSLTMLSTLLAEISEYTGLAMAVDAGNGFGNAFNVGRTVRMLERSGAQAIQIADEACHDPDRGRAAADMIGKLKAATDAGSSALIIARTSCADASLGQLIDLASAYAEAGADVVAIDDGLARPSRSRFAAWALTNVPMMLTTDRDTNPADIGEVAVLCQPLRLQARMFDAATRVVEAPLAASSAGPSAAVRSIAH